MYDAVCLASGGLDSLVCLLLLRKQGIRALPVFINYGQRNLDKELESLVVNVKKHQFDSPVIIDVSGFGDAIQTGLTSASKDVYEDAFTPNRNLLFLVLGASVAFTKGASALVVGLLSEKTAIFPDQSDRFLDIAAKAMSESLGVNLRIICPLRDFFKSDVVSLARELGIKQSYSCHSGAEEPCGKCIACLEYS